MALFPDDDKSNSMSFMTFEQARDLMLIRAVGWKCEFFDRYFDLRLLKAERTNEPEFTHGDALVLAEVDVHPLTLVEAKNAGITPSELIEVSRIYEGDSRAINRYIKQRTEKDPHQLALESISAQH